MTRLMIVIGFVVWFGAGLAVGWRIGSSHDQPPRPPHGGGGSATGGGWLGQRLNLTADQRKQLDAIWSPLARRGGREGFSQRAQLRRERDAAIAALVPESDKAAYQKIIDDYSVKTAALESQWKQSFTQAVEKTRAILTPEQREKYDELMARTRREWETGRDHAHRPPPPPPPESENTEQPQSPSSPGDGPAQP
ncbi:MAG: Spy/CpxP family protein refolding chaperone [Phycisphaeraceae bacterium]